MRKLTCIYLAKNKPAIVAPMHHNLAGIYYEQENPITVPDWSEGEGLIAALRLAFERFSLCDQNLRESKTSDWLSYISSRCRSMNRFEREFLRIEVWASNDAELFYDASAEPPGETDIVLHVTHNRYVAAANDEMKHKLLRLFDACMIWYDRTNDVDQGRPCA